MGTASDAVFFPFGEPFGVPAGFFNHAVRELLRLGCPSDMASSPNEISAAMLDSFRRNNLIWSNLDSVERPVCPFNLSRVN